MFSAKVKVFHQTLKHYKGQVWINEEGETYLRVHLLGKMAFIKYLLDWDGDIEQYLAVHTEFDEERRLKS